MKLYQILNIFCFLIATGMLIGLGFVQQFYFQHTWVALVDLSIALGILIFTCKYTTDVIRKNLHLFEEIKEDSKEEK